VIADASVKLSVRAPRLSVRVSRTANAGAVVHSRKSAAAAPDLSSSHSIVSGYEKEYWL
jgi:hypothetical protein